MYPQGGNTGPCGAAVPDAEGRGIVMSLGRMNKVRALDPVNFTITVEAGAVLADVGSDSLRASERMIAFSSRPQRLQPPWRWHDPALRQNGCRPLVKDYRIVHCLFRLQKGGFQFELKGGTSLS
jgi:hypothetical protein